MCQIVGLQGCTSPRRGTWRLGGSGACWPSKIGASPPFESLRALGWPWVDRLVAKTPGQGRVAGLWGPVEFRLARSASGKCWENMVTTQAHVTNAQMLYNQFQSPWQPVDRLCAERFVCQIVGLQGCTSPRRGTGRLGGSGDRWPFKIGASPPFESSRALGGPRVDRLVMKTPGVWPGGQAVKPVEFRIARSTSGTCWENMVTTQAHVTNAQMLYNQFQSPWQPVDRLCAERFVCQIVGLQGCTSPRRGTGRLGGSGDRWPFKIGASPPFESPRALRRPRVEGRSTTHRGAVGWSGCGAC